MALFVAHQPDPARLPIHQAFGLRGLTASANLAHLVFCLSPWLLG